MECSGRDSDPGRRLERPAYLAGLYYRSAFVESTSRIQIPMNKPYPSGVHLFTARLALFALFWGKQKTGYLFDEFSLGVEFFFKIFHPFLEVI